MYSYLLLKSKIFKKKKGIETRGNKKVTNCHQLKLKTHDGKYRLTVVCYIEERLGEKVVTKDNILNYQYIDDVKQIEK